MEPGALSDQQQLRDFNSRYYIFHYTYQFEYMMDGTPCQPEPEPEPEPTPHP